MNPSFKFASPGFYLGLLRGACLLVPGELREEWLEDWRSELWYVQREYSSIEERSAFGKRRITAFCLGAYKDAYYLRRQNWRTKSLLPQMCGSAVLCVFSLAAVLAMSYGITFLAPGLRAERRLSHYRVYSGFFLQQDARYYGNGSSPIPAAEQFRKWVGNSQRYLDAIAFYRIGEATMSSQSHSRDALQVAYASSNLFALLGSPAQPIQVEPAKDNLPKLILSDEVWRRDFSGSVYVTGTVVFVGSIRARIAGVAPRNSWWLPEKADVWLMEPDSEIVFHKGVHAIGHLRPWGDFEIGPRWAITLFAVVLAFFSLPGTVSVAMSEYSSSSRDSFRMNKLRFWAYLSAKITLLLPIVYFVSLDCAYSCIAPWQPSAGYIQFSASFLICLFGLRWIFQDHQQRCPVCLRRVAPPARVGQPSRIFELICVGGHALLHVPELPANWLNAQRWSYLDASWRFLLTNSSRAWSTPTTTDPYPTSML
jgi:hypothetical protein